MTSFHAEPEPNQALAFTCACGLAPTIFFSSLESYTESDSDFARLPLETYLYSATTAAVVRSQLHEPCSVYYPIPDMTYNVFSVNVKPYSVNQSISVLFRVIIYETNNFHIVSCSLTRSWWRHCNQGKPPNWHHPFFIHHQTHEKKECCFLCADSPTPEVCG